jgi:uncharacterized membrane protein
MPDRRDRDSSDGVKAVAVGIGLASIAAAAGSFLLARSSRRPEIETDAPRWTLDKKAQGERAVFGKSLLVGRPRRELFAFWKNFENFPRFMENVERVETLGGGRSRWTIKAPAGSEVTLVNRISEIKDGDYISWQSEEESDIANSGKVLFEDAPAGRGTYVSLIIGYEPPGGTFGRLFAKIMQREPEIQARRDLRRFKQLMETGEVATNASPSGRKSESPDQPRI